MTSQPGMQDPFPVFDLTRVKTEDWARTLKAAVAFKGPHTFYLSHDGVTYKLTLSVEVHSHSPQNGDVI